MKERATPAKLFIVACLASLAIGCATPPHNVLVPAVTGAKAAPGTASSGSSIGKSTASTAAKRPASVSAKALGVYRTPAEMHAPPSDDELAVVESAQTLIGKAPESSVVVNGKRFVLDCIGTVAAIFYGMYIDVTKDFPHLTGSGVERLYRSLKNEGVLHHDKYPRPGDVVIWNNTWDANGDGDTNDDPHTHAGVVLAVDEDGTIHYVHENYRRGVIVEVMNLLKPNVYRNSDGRVLNSPMAMAPKPGEKRAVHWVSGDLFGAFGDVLGAKAYYRVASAGMDGRSNSALTRNEVRLPVSSLH